MLPVLINRSSGPFLKVILTIELPKRKVDIHASGFVSVLGIQAEALLRITNTQYEYRIAGKFLHLFQASLRITANYGDIKRAGFRVHGHLKNDFFAIVHKKIQKDYKNFLKLAQKQLIKQSKELIARRLFLTKQQKAAISPR